MRSLPISFQELGGWISICLSLLCLSMQAKGCVEASCPLVVLHYLTLFFFFFFLGVCRYRCGISLNSVEML